MWPYKNLPQKRLLHFLCWHRVLQGGNGFRRNKHSAWCRVRLQPYVANYVCLEIFICSNFQMLLKHWNELLRKVNKLLFFLVVIPTTILHMWDIHDTGPRRDKDLIGKIKYKSKIHQPPALALQRSLHALTCPVSFLGGKKRKPGFTVSALRWVDSGISHSYQYIHLQGMWKATTPT